MFTQVPWNYKTDFNNTQRFIDKKYLPVAAQQSLAKFLSDGKVNLEGDKVYLFRGGQSFVISYTLNDVGLKWRRRISDGEIFQSLEYPELKPEFTNEDAREGIEERLNYAVFNINGQLLTANADGENTRLPKYPSVRYRMSDGHPVFYIKESGTDRPQKRGKNSVVTYDFARGKNDLVFHNQGKRIKHIIPNVRYLIECAEISDDSYIVLYRGLDGAANFSAINTNIRGTSGHKKLLSNLQEFDAGSLWKCYFYKWKDSEMNINSIYVTYKLMGEKQQQTMRYCELLNRANVK